MQQMAQDKRTSKVVEKEDRKSEIKSFRIRQEDKFYGRLLSKESSSSNPSFRVYYTVASGAVPFNWETRPGTPKATDPSSDVLLPPLTPPPASYLYHHPPSSHSSLAQRRRSSTPAAGLCIPGALLSRLKHRKLLQSPDSPSHSLASSTLSSPVALTALTGQPRQGRLSSSASSLSSMEEGSDAESPRSTLCFRGGGRVGGMVLLKKMVTSLVGHGSTTDDRQEPKGRRGLISA